MSKPDVSVILPTFNRIATLPRAVASVLGQTLTNLELIVVDDASDDGTKEWLETLQDSRLRVIRNDNCSGAARSRNVGIGASRAELIAFQDSDDEWTPTRLASQVALLRSADPEVGWVGGAYRVADEIISSIALVKGENYSRELLIGKPFVTPTWLVKKHCLEEAGMFDASMPCLEDWDLIFKLSRICRFMAVEDLILIRHSSPDSLFANLPRRKRGLEIILTRHRDQWRQDHRLYSRWCTELGRLHVLQDELIAGRRQLYEALRYRPLQPRALLLMLASFINQRLLKRISRSRLAVQY